MIFLRHFPAGLGRWTLIWSLILAILAPSAWALEPLDLQVEFISLKERLESGITENSDPAAVACLAAETTALAWLLAAVHLMEDEESRREWLAKAADFRESWAESGDWDARHLAALEHYYDALSELSIFLVSENQQKPLALEWQQIREKTKQQLALLNGKPESSLEKRVLLSGALVSLSSVAVRSVGGGSMTRPVRQIITELMEKSKNVNQRSDLHYRAKLSLLYAGNLQGLTALTFLLGMNAGPPLSGDLATLHGTLNKYGPGSSLPQATSLTWTAQAQASLPLAYWLASQAGNPSPEEEDKP